MNRYWQRMSPHVRDHAGVIVKCLGDGMMAVFADGVDDAVVDISFTKDAFLSGPFLEVPQQVLDGGVWVFLQQVLFCVDEFVFSAQ